MALLDITVAIYSFFPFLLVWNIAYRRSIVHLSLHRLYPAKNVRQLGTVGSSERSTCMLRRYSNLTILLGDLLVENNYMPIAEACLWIPTSFSRSADRFLNESTQQTLTITTFLWLEGTRSSQYQMYILHSIRCMRASHFLERPSWVCIPHPTTSAAIV